MSASAQPTGHPAPREPTWEGASPLGPQGTGPGGKTSEHTAAGPWGPGPTGAEVVRSEDRKATRDVDEPHAGPLEPPAEVASAGRTDPEREREGGREGGVGSSEIPA